MTTFETVRVAAIQATPVILDVEGTIEKAERLLHEAADAGAPPGSLWNPLAYFGPAGFLGKHRKLMPTVHERLFHAVGAGDDLQVHDTPVARIGGLICWENIMPLARYAVYRGGPQIYLAPTADDSESWLGSMRHIAYEAGAFVVSVPQFIPAAAFPDDFPVRLPEGKEIFGNGGA